MKLHLLILLLFVLSACSSGMRQLPYQRYCLDMNHVSKKEIDSKLEEYSRKIAVYPNVGSHYSCRAFTYMYKENWQSALKDLSKAIELNGYGELKPTLIYYRGITKELLFKPEEALLDYEEAFEIASWEERRYSMMTYSLAMAYLNQANLTKAMEYADLSVKWQEYYDVPLYVRGLIHVEKMDYEAALRDINLALKYTGRERRYIQSFYDLSQNPRALYLAERAGLYAEMDRVVAAEADLNQAFSLGKKDADVLIKLAQVMSMTSAEEIRDSELAIVLAKKGLQLSTKPSFAALEAMAHAYANRGEFTKALAILDSALAQEDLYLGKLWRDRVELTRKVFEQGKSLYPDMAYAAE